MPLLKPLGRVTQLNGAADLLINEDSGSRVYQLQKGDSGKVLFIEQDDSQIDIFLPRAIDAGAGWYMNFIIRAVSSSLTEIRKHADDDNNLYGIISANTSSYGDASNDIGQDYVDFDSNTEIGDRLEIFCDGTKFYCYGHSGVHGAMEFKT